MRCQYLPILIALRSVLKVKAYKEGDAPRTTMPGNGLGIHRQADPTATVTLGPTSNYIASIGSNTPKPSPDSFTLVPAGNPESGGIDLVLGGDLQQKMSSVLKDKCHDARSEGCTSALQDALPIKQVALQRRQVGLLADIFLIIRPVFAAIIGAVAGTGSARMYEAYRAPMNDLNQAVDPTSASAIAFITSAKASPTIIPVMSDNVAIEEPSIETGKNGGFTIHAPQDLAHRTYDLLAQHSNGGCPGSSMRRELSLSKIPARGGPPDGHTVDCVIKSTVIAFTAMVKGPIAEWVRLSQRTKDIITPLGPGAIMLLQNVGNQVSALRSQLPSQLFKDEQWDALVRIAYWEVYSIIILQKEGVEDVTISGQDVNARYCLPKDDLSCSDDACKGKNGQCAPNSRLGICDCGNGGELEKCPEDWEPPCINCGGDAGGNKCTGVTPARIWKDCPCWNEDPLPPPPFETEQEFKDAQDYLHNLEDRPANPAPPKDDNADPIAQCQGVNLVSLETDYFVGLTNSACKDFPGDPSKSFGLKLTSKDAGPEYSNAYKDWTVDFSWEDKPGKCKANCKTIFEAFIHSSTSCSPNSHSMAKSGEIDMSCGKAKYSVIPASSATPTSSAAAAETPTNCPAKYPTYGSDDDKKKWSANNKCDRKCPNKGFQQVPLFAGAGICLDKGCIEAHLSTCAL